MSWQWQQGLSDVCASSAYLQSSFLSVTACKSDVSTTYNVGPFDEPYSVYTVLGWGLSTFSEVFCWIWSVLSVSVTSLNVTLVVWAQLLPTEPGHVHLQSHTGTHAHIQTQAHTHTHTHRLTHTHRGYHCTAWLSPRYNNNFNDVDLRAPKS